MHLLFYLELWGTLFYFLISLLSQATLTTWWRVQWPVRSACRPSRTPAAWSTTWRCTAGRRRAGCVARCSRGWPTSGGTSPRCMASTCSFNHCLRQHLGSHCLVLKTLELFSNIAFRIGKKQNWYWNTQNPAIIILLGIFHSGEASPFHCPVVFGKAFKYVTSLKWVGEPDQQAHIWVTTWSATQERQPDPDCGRLDRLSSLGKIQLEPKQSQHKEMLSEETQV